MFSKFFAYFKSIPNLIHLAAFILIGIAAFFAAHQKKIWIPLALGLAFLIFYRYLVGEKVSVPKI